MTEKDQTNEGGVIDNFEIMQQIGSGAFSRVHVAHHIPTNNYAAVKVINLSQMKDAEYVAMLREISVFMQVDHPNICHLYRTSTCRDFLLFFMEYVPCGTLLDLVNQKKGLSEGEAQHYFIQLFSAVRHLHMFHFLVHRDLKLENVLIGKKGTVKLTDFGLAGTSYNNLMHTFVGTPGYQSPEVVAGNEYTEKCDVWSLGVCLFAMLEARLPFSCQNTNFKLFMQEIFELKMPSKFSPLLQDLLSKMLAPKPEQRPSLMQLQDHPWLKGLKRLGTNIAPQPIMFQIARNIAAIAKFRRRKTTADEKVLEKCREMGIDTEKLVQCLIDGETTDDTTTYWMLAYPNPTKPEVRPPTPEKRVVLQDEPKSDSKEKLPALNPPGKRSESRKSLTNVNKRSPVVSKLLTGQPRIKSSGRILSKEAPTMPRKPLPRQRL